eukprot:TRINITY_DN13142_c0_g1_i1.p3 TRINITY_DN13142_c0_g1~~TRINITY_DN13142_c0_g1_i1.p3  ORF type:complete len:208 (-),score=32.23 TRINITY_DN13142_c0_g1_i1:124-747(-)
MGNPKHNVPKRGQQVATQELGATVSAFAGPNTPEPQEQQTTILYGENGEGSFELSNWNAEVWEIPGAGLNGGHGICGKVYPGGAISLRGGIGSFKGHMMVEFWTRTADGIANAAINIQGSSRGCHPLMFQHLEASEHSDGFSRYNVALSQFVEGSHAIEDVANPSAFVGCNGMSVDEIERVSFHNYEAHEQFFCIDEIALSSNINGN